MRFSRSIIVLIFIIGFTVLAQEATEPPVPPPTLTETPTLIPTFTETATLLPSETATASPSPTETATLPVIETPPAEVTAEPSPEITAEVTPEVTVEAATDPTPESTVTPFVPSDPQPEPPLTAVVSDAFVSDSTNAWSLGAGWSLVPVGDNFALQVTDSTQPAISNGSLYQDLAVELLLQSTSGTLLLHLRDFYTLRLAPAGQVDLYFRDTWLAGATTTPAVPGQWRHLRFAVIGTTLRAAVDGVELLALRDPNPVMNAAPVAVSAVFPPDSAPQTLLVDNIRFWIPQAQVTSVPVAPLALPTGISLIEQSEYFWDWTPAVSDLGWTITGGSLVTGLGIRAAWNTFQNQMYGARIELTLDQTVSVDRIIMTFSQLHSFDRITMLLLDVNGSIVRSMSANYPTLQQQTFDEVSPWQQVRTIRLSWQTGNGNSHLSTVRLIPDGVLEPSPTPSPTSTMTPTETPSPTSTPTPTETPTPAFNVIVVDGSGAGTQAIRHLGSQTANVESLPFTSDGTCTIREAILSANNGGSIPEQPDDPNPTDCLPSKADNINVPPDFIAVELFPNNISAISIPLDPISGKVLVRRRIGDSGLAILERSDGAGNFRIFEIMGGGSLILENVIVRNGYTTENGGGILNAGAGETVDVNGTPTFIPGLTLTNSAVIDNFAEGSGGGIYNTGTATITGSCITGNTSSNGTSVHSTTPMTATNNWWGAVNGPAINGVGTGDLIAGNVTWNPHNPLPQTGNGIPCNTNRDVAPEAQAFHDHWRVFGLPRPFDVFPYQDVNLTDLSVQGYGPNTFSEENWGNNYTGTYGIHPGLDYGSWDGCYGDWCKENIVSLCDGVVTRGRNTDGSGGSASIGWGVSVRCFDNTLALANPNESLDLLDYDTDGDGNPNLSNIVITYNHLGQCTEWELDANNNDVCPQENKVNTRFPEYYADVSGTGVVVRQGQFLGTTGRHPYDHLHLEMYLARGYESANSAIVLNPLFMYSYPLLNLHNQQKHHIRAYYPVRLDWTNRDPETSIKEDASNIVFGIFFGDLDRWTQGGHRSRSGSVFWSIQEPIPTTIVEWPSDLTPLLQTSTNNDNYTNDFLGYLNLLYPPGSSYVSHYIQTYGVSPNCVVVPDTSQIWVNCPRDDLIAELP